MVNWIGIYRIIRKIHLFSAFTIGFMMLYFITGFLFTRHDLFHSQEEKIIPKEYQLSLPEGISVEELSAYIQEKFDVKGHRDKIQNNNKGEIIIPYRRPGMRYQAIISSDRKNIIINSTVTNLRSKIVILHRLNGYGGGFIYDFYTLMIDLTAISIIVFAFTGLYLGLFNGKQLIPKLLFLALGTGYTLLVIISFMNS